MATSDLLTLIKDKQNQIAQLQAELDEARALLTGAASPGAAVGGTNPPVRRVGTKASNSTALATAVLKETGRPMHVNDMLSRINQKFGQTVKYATLVGNLARMVKARKTFHRFGPNMYGLIEWREEQLKLRA